MNTVKTVTIHKYKLDHAIDQEDLLIVECPLTLYINDREYATLLCSPSDLEALVVGYLHGEYLVKKHVEIDEMTIDEEKGLVYLQMNHVNLAEDLRIRYITSGCASSAVYYNTMDALKLRQPLEPTLVSLQTVLKNMMGMNQSAHLFKLTGGVHMASLFDDSRHICTFEDIGRHNAVDKIVGRMVIDSISPQGKMMLVTGRISSEMVLKCAKIGISVIVSRSAPMDKAIQIAEKLNMVVIGFARGEKANVYTGFQHVEV